VKARAKPPAKLASIDDVPRVFDEARALLAPIRRVREIHAKFIMPDPVYPKTYMNNARFERKIRVWADILVRAAAARLREGLHWCRSQPGTQAAARFDALFATFAREPDAEPYDLKKWVYPAAVIFRAHEPIAIDGDLSEWAAWPETTIPQADTGQAQPAGTFRLAYDDKHLYIACRVRDAVMVQTHTDGQIWRQDSIQIAINTARDPVARPGTYGRDVYEYGFARTPGGDVCWCWSSPQKRLGRMKDVPVAIRRQGDVTFYEIALPWARLAPLGPASLPWRVTLGVVINDDDGQGRRTAEWGGGIATTKDARLFLPVDFER